MQTSTWLGLAVRPADVGEPAVDAERLLRELDALASFGADDRGGITRPGLETAEHRARQHLIRSTRASGLLPTVDEAGNLIVRRRRRNGGPVLLMGSHLDSVVHGGRFDGAYGVVAAIEALRIIDACDAPLRYDPVAVAFANEEGARFGPPFWGSLALTGRLDHGTERVDHTDEALRAALSAAGCDLDAIGSAAWPAGSIGAFLEVHIEQGPVLEHDRVPIGVVDGIVGRTLFEVCIRGEQGHAGTVPMDRRRDALAAAAQLILAVQALAAERRLCRVATVGRVEADPNVANVIAGIVRLTVEVRDMSSGRLAAAEAEVARIAARVQQETGTTVGVEVTMRISPVPTDPAIRTAIAAAADELSLRHRQLPSGAGHDAQIVATMAPVGMIFVPSRAGVSHAAAEYTDSRQLVDGANVLLRTALRL